MSMPNSSMPDQTMPARSMPAQTVPAEKPKAIVVGVDGSDCALGAVRWAAREAVRRGAPLRILHAADYLGHQDGGAPSPELPHARQIAAKGYTIARHTEKDVVATTEVVAGDAATALLRAAADSQLVVLGSSTTGAAEELVFASIALRVSARSPEPVVIVPRQRGRTPAHRPIAAVLSGDEHEDDAVAAFAADAARAFGVPLMLLQTARHSGADAATDPTEWQQRLSGVEVSVTDLPGASPTQVLAAACPSPLVVLSTGPGSVLHRSLDGPHRWLLRHSTSPMAVVPPRGRSGAEADEESAAVG